jgi:hypothetical protein
MEVISYIVLILLSLLGYSVGVVIKAGKDVDIKPQILDIVLVPLIWAAAVYSRLALDWNKWLMILIWLALSMLIGALATWPPKAAYKATSAEKAQTGTPSALVPKTIFQRIWQKFKEFMNRAGSFQSRIILSLFFFIVVTPIALAVKLASDPLRISYKDNDSHWLTRTEAENDLEQSKKQF